MRPTPTATVSLVLVAAMLGLVACETREGAPPPNSTQPVQLTFLHTSDWHSRLLPYDLQLAATDERLIRGYAPESPILDSKSPLVQIGGLTRLATLIKRERRRNPATIWLDSGDCFQGAPIFNAFSGEVETRALSMLGADAVVIGNHEFDKGLDNLARQYGKWATFPVLAANYVWDRDIKGAEEMARITRPYTIVNAGGLRVGIIGMANLSSLNSAGEGNNSLGFTPIDEVQIVQFYIDQLAGSVDLIGITSHLGLTASETENELCELQNGERVCTPLGPRDRRLEDYQVIEQTTGLDFVFGGHLHVVLDPPQTRYDRTGRPVVLTHSGAFMKYLGKLDVVARNSGDPFYGWEVESHRYDLFPVDESVPEDPAMIRFLEPYILELNRQFDLTRIIAYAPRLIPRFGREKANSELGNIAAESMADRRGVQADFALTNTLGIRTDVIRGPITQDQMFNVFPFDNFVTKMYLNGRDLCDLMTFVARRSAGRGCQPQAQFSDRIHLTLNCLEATPECSFASEVAVRDQPRYDACLESGRSAAVCDGLSRTPVDPFRVYEVGVNDYISRGGSGFRVLKFNNARIPTDISIREAVSDRFQTYPTCEDACMQECAGRDAPSDCVDRVNDQLNAGSVARIERTDCESLPNCYEDVAAYQERFCEGRAPLDPRTLCDAVDRTRGPAPIAPPTTREAACALSAADKAQQILAGVYNGAVTYCGAVRRQAAQLEPGEALPDDCFLGKLVPNLANAACLSVDEGYGIVAAALRELGLPALSDQCECAVNAQIRADAECRELSCVVGRADDRMEAVLYDDFSSACAAYGGQVDAKGTCVLPETATGAEDLCVSQAFAAGCDEEALAYDPDEESN